MRPGVSGRTCGRDFGTDHPLRPTVSFYSEKIFPRLLALVSPHFDDDRRRLLGGARGRVLEIGVGTGASLGFYGSDVEELVGIDVNEGVLQRARARARRLQDAGRVTHGVTLEEADAQELPYDDASFDTVVAFLTLCSIPDPDAAAAELRRVLKPGGLLLVLEHVRAPRGSALARWQNRLDPLWSHLAVGCHANRETGAILERAGFEAARLERYREPRTWTLTAPRIRGSLTV